ncbi:MAG: fluoride efflux transporter CrcB [Methanosarcinaceae archaeon]|nr:fluoride efflux transporter CrcB [Methanosarcinaceae archaeon]MDF1533078.1 fluoride efflux transporter CrcB [Methanosarcinaceae archaeon]
MVPDAFVPVILVGLGGFFGAILRYLVSGMVARISELPTGTLIVNVIGSTALSIITFSSVPDSIMYLVNIGLFSSFTTFSTFAYETFKLLEEGENMYFILNISLNVLLCLTGVFAGYFVVNFI